MRSANSSSSAGAITQHLLGYRSDPDGTPRGNLGFKGGVNVWHRPTSFIDVSYIPSAFLATLFRYLLETPVRFRPSRASCSARLSLESLEDRLAPATFTVINTDDDGVGSLRWAITRANAVPGADTIAFNVSGGGFQTVNLLSALPTITERVAINGTTQSGFAGTPLIELSGRTGVGDSGHGLVIGAGASGSAVRGLVINEFADGIRIRADNCRVTGSFIGTDAAGTAAAANAGAGVTIIGGTGNIVGGTTAAARNVISGNEQFGVAIFGGGATGNQVIGNFIGTDVTGDVDLSNSDGVVIAAGANGNFVGGTTAGAGNLISGNSNGVNISGSGTSGNRVKGNLIGSDVTGTLDLGNQFNGVRIGAGATNNVVGGSTPAARNVISGNNIHGVAIDSAGTIGNIVRGNYIGTDISGTAALGNTADGVSISATARSNTIGGNVAGAGNLISGNGGSGVAIIETGTYANVVAGNRIGTTTDGMVDLGNSITGVAIANGARNNIVGGNVAGARNIISGNDSQGVSISGAGTTGNRVQGNFIGTDATGALDLGNSFQGVLITNEASNNVVGGAAAAARNVISGNETDGVQISGVGTSGNRVLGNFIGTDRTGTAALGNTTGLVVVDGATGTVVGGTVAGAGNVVSGNNTNGVLLFGFGTTGNQVLGNLIGTDKTGTVPLGNSFQGLIIFGGASDNVVGGAAAGARNVISANGSNGVLLINFGTTGNRIQGNRIGLAATSPAPLGNGARGVSIESGAANNRVGGTAAGTGNAIAHNAVSGITAFTGTGNSILGNRIFDNGGLGIDLGDDGLTANDLNDGDGGANNLLNFPELSLARVTTAGLRIAGSINTEPNRTLRIEFFSSPAADPSGHGEGQRFLGAITVQTGAGNDATFSVLLAISGVQVEQVVTATATDELGNTSEFSLALAIS